jgi:hypothetical protein
MCSTTGGTTATGSINFVHVTPSILVHYIVQPV